MPGRVYVELLREGDYTVRIIFEILILTLALVAYGARMYAHLSARYSLRAVSLLILHSALVAVLVVLIIHLP